MSMIPFTNFTKGELAPELQARIDTQQYQAAAKKVRNFIIQKYGGLSFRPGFRFVGEVDDVSHAIRYIPFQYNIEQSYIMSVEDNKLRLLAGGGFVVEDNIKITAITQAENALVSATYHGLAVGDRVYFSGISGMTQMNGRTGKVLVVPNADSFIVDIDSTDFTTFISSDGITRVAPVPPPAPSPPPPAPPPEPTPPPPTTGGGGSGTAIGELPGWQLDGRRRSNIDTDI